MAAPRYFQTEDEKRMAAIRANPSGRPVQLVRPMRPAGSDSREKWRENAGGKMIGMDQYLENNRKMYTMENVPTAARTSAPKEQITSKNKQMAILGQYGGAQPVQGSDNRPSGVYDEKGKLVESDNRSPGVYNEKGERMNRFGSPTAPTPQDIAEMEKAGDFYSPPTAPTPQDIAEMEKAGTADMSPRFSPIEMRGSTLNAWQSGSLESPIARKDPYATMLNDRPGGGRTYESPF